MSPVIEDSSGNRRARRRRRASPQPGPVPSAPPPVAATAAPQQQSERRPARRQRGEAKDGGDRNLRDLVGAGPSQLGPSKALRVRDADRPSVDELAAAERNVVIVRRNWTPEEN